MCTSYFSVAISSHISHIPIIYLYAASNIENWYVAGSTDIFAARYRKNKKHMEQSTLLFRVYVKKN